MGLEAATYIHQLNPSNPVGAVDPKAQGDDHLRMIKAAVQATLPNLTGAMTRTQIELNAMAASTGFAAPSVDVDIAAPTAGIATTILRSDAKLRLSQGIAPTWTAIHTFSNSVNFNGATTFTKASGVVNSTWTDGVVVTNYYSSGASTAANFGTNSNHPLNLKTNDVARFTIAANGTLSAPGAGNWTGTHTFSAAGGAPLRVDAASNHSFSVNTSDAANGCYTSFNVSGVPVGYIGTGPNLVSGQSVANWGILAVGSLLFGYGGGSLGFTLAGDGGVFMRNATGSSKGQGTINATVVFANGVELGFRTIPQNIQNANYTALLADSAKHILHGNGAGAGHTYTIPANAAVAYDIGTTITFINRDSNVISIAITTDTLILANSVLTGTRTLAQNGIATAIKVAATTWMISGPGVS